MWDCFVCAYKQMLIPFFIQERKPMPQFNGWSGSQPNKTLPPGQQEKQFSLGVYALSQQRIAEAAELFSKLPETNGAAQYNSALCYFHGGKYEQAQTYLAKAKQLLSPLTSNPLSLVFTTLYSQELNQEDYLAPILEEEFSLFPQQITNRLLESKLIFIWN